MIIDCHGHYTTAPQSLTDFRDAQVAALKDPAQAPSRASLKISDVQIRDSLEKAQLEQVLHCSAIGSPETVKRSIDAFIARTGADELILASHIYDHAARVRAYEITAKACGIA